MHPFLELLATFSPDNHTRGVQFEKLCKWLLENHPMACGTDKNLIQMTFVMNGRSK